MHRQRTPCSPGSYQCRHPAGWAAHPYAGRFAEAVPIPARQRQRCSSSGCRSYPGDADIIAEAEGRKASQHSVYISTRYRNLRKRSRFPHGGGCRPPALRFYWAMRLRASARRAARSRNLPRTTEFDITLGVLMPRILIQRCSPLPTTNISSLPVTRWIASAIWCVSCSCSCSWCAN